MALDMGIGAADLRADVERNADDLDARPCRGLNERHRGLRIAAELAGQVHHRVRAAVRQAQQQPRAVAVGPELGEFVRVVHDEGRDAVFERVADVDIALDRVRVDAARGLDTGGADAIHLAIGGEIEPGALRGQHPDDRRIGLRLQRVMQVHAGQGRRERAVLSPDDVAVDEQQRRAESRGQRPKRRFAVGLGETKSGSGVAIPADPGGRVQVATHDSSGSTSRNKRSSAPRLASSTPRPAAPIEAQSARFPSSSATASPSSAVPATTRAAPASSSRQQDRTERVETRRTSGRRQCGHRGCQSKSTRLHTGFEQ